MQSPCFLILILFCLFVETALIHAGESSYGISGNPGAVNILIGTGELGDLLHIPKRSGFRLAGLWMGDYNTLLSGGDGERHHRRWTSNSLLILDLSIDLQKAVGWKSAFFGAEFLQFNGQPTNADAGVVQGYNSLPGDPPLNRSELYQLWIRQEFLDNKLSVRIGKTVPTYHFNNVSKPVPTDNPAISIPSVSGLIYTPIFVNTTLLGAIGGYYNSVYGIVATLAPVKQAYINIGFYDGNVARGVQTGLRGPHFNGYYFSIIEGGYGWTAPKPGIAAIADVAKFYVAHDIQKRRGMHTLTGPVYVEGAEPGDVLEIRVLDIQLSDFGYNFLSPTQGILSEFTKPRIKYFKYDKENNTTEFVEGVCLQLKPFPGILAVAPPLDWPKGWPVNIQAHMGHPVTGEFNSVPPGPFGGNLDQPELQAGAILFVPVFQKGALVWTGDSHAMQSNGEIDITALETSYESITLQLIVRKDLRAEGVSDQTKRKGGNAFTWPIIENSTHWMIVGLNVDLFEAMKLASRNAIDFLVRTQGLTPEESYQFLSMVGDFEIAEAVNVIKNVTVHIPKEPFKGVGKTSTLCSEGTFPLEAPKVNVNAVCTPQEGITLE